jgi:tetratricopeptide (TPR) repeat protein
LPLIFLLIDFYKGRKFEKYLILEKIPFFAISLLFGLLASHIQSEGAAIAKFETFTWLQRLAFASYGMSNYIYKLFVPIHLSCFYPYPNLTSNHLPILFYVCPVIVFGLFVLVFLSLKKNKILAFGFLFFCITVALVLQFISVGQVIVADRYSYLSYVGLLFPLAMSYDWLQHQADKKTYKQLSTLLLIASASMCLWLSFERTKVWKNSDVLWTDAIKKYPNSEASYRNRGSYLINKAAYDKGQKNVGEIEIDRAFEDFNISIKLNPNNAKVFTNRANIFGLKGRFDLALKDYSKAIELDKTDEQTFFNRAVTYSMMKQFDKAIEDYNTALKIKPDFKSARQSRAYAYVDNKNYDKAIAELNELIQSDATNAIYYFYRGTAYFNSGNAPAALADNTTAIQLNPNNSDAYFNRSVVNKSLGKFKDALNDALKAQSLGHAVNPNYINELKSKTQ